MRAIWLVTLLLVFPAAPALALSVAFSGELSLVDDPNGLLPAAFTTGTAFSGSYAFDPADTSVSLPGNGDDSAIHQVLAGSFSVQVGTWTFAAASPPLGALFITDGGLLGTDAWTLSVPGPASPDPDFTLILLIAFEDSTQTRLGDEAPFVNASLDGWGGARFSLVAQEQGCFPGCGLGLSMLASGPLDEVTLVPEPSAAALLFAGLAMLARRPRFVRAS